MRVPYAHEAEIVVVDGGDLRAPGGAITEALCGSLDHQPPCPLAAHRTSVVRSGDVVTVRVLFASEPAHEERVRAGIDAALSGAEYAGPDGSTTRWRLLARRPSPVREAEADHAARLAGPVSP